MRTMKWTGLFLVLLLLSVALGACSDDNEKEGASCTKNSECASADKVCRDGKCVKLSDANDPDGGLGDGGVPPIEAEAYAVSYYLEHSIVTPKVYELRLMAGETDVKLHPEDVDCGPPATCIVSKDLKHFVYTVKNEDVTGAQDVYVAPLGADFKFASEGALVVSAVRALREVDGLLTYSREVSGVDAAFYMELGKHEEHLIGDVGSSSSSAGEAGWVIDPKSKQAARFVQGLQTMDVFIGKLGEPITTMAFTVNAENYQEIGGSYFSGQTTAAFSADGKYLSFLTTAPNDYEACTNADPATISPECKGGPGQICGRFNRCTAIEVTAHFIKLADQGNLGKECFAMDECGDVHICDTPSDTAFDDARCVPGRAVVGLPKRGVAGQTGCALTESNPDYQYTNLRGPLSFDASGKLYAVAGRECPGLNIEQTDIVSFDPVTKKRETIWGNPGKDYSDGLCYDEASRTTDVTNCIVRVNKAVLSPGGNDLVFMATNPQVADPGWANDTMDLWRVRRDGKDHEWIGGHSEFYSVGAFQVHEMP